MNLGKKDKREIDRTLSIFSLDERWQLMRDKILGGEVPYEAGLRGFQLCIDAELETLGDFPVRKAQADASSQSREIPIIDLGDDTDDDLFVDSSPTEPRLLARVDLHRILRVADEAVREENRRKDSDPVGDWRAQIQKFYKSYGFHVEVPRPEVTREELADWRADGWELLFRPADGVASYEQLTRAFGHENLWTICGEARSKICFEPAREGYWFLAEAREVCPRTGKTYEDYLQETPENHRLLCLEEYNILWHVMKDIFGAILDLDGPTLLRTNFGLSEVLFARSNIDKTTVELIIRGWAKKIAFKKMGTRYCRQMPFAA